MKTMREKFEELSSIKPFLLSFHYCDKSGEYVRSKLFTQPGYTLGFFNGAWYAFQEQQKKIDAIVQLVYNETEDYDLDLKIQELLNESQPK